MYPENKFITIANMEQLELIVRGNDNAMSYIHKHYTIYGNV